MSQQQTLLRVRTNIPSATISGATEYQYLDLYDDVPIKINKSFAELQDISKKNTDFSVNLSLPGSKTNNRFFESFYNVDADSLYFFSNKKTACDVLIDNQSFFNGYMRLNKVSVLDSKVEYDVTLFSSVANLFGDIGNNLLKDLNFSDPEYTFNHTFNLLNTVTLFQDQATNFGLNRESPFMYFYPIVHNGYEYTGSTINLSGGTTNEQTRFYTSTGPISGWTGSTEMFAAGVQHYRINTPGEGIYDNQLKPALSMWGLLKLIFKTYGYTITSDFMNTPWMKTLYMYGYFSSSATKFSYSLSTIDYLPLEGVELIYSGSTTPNSPLDIIVCKRGTGIPVYCSENINYGFANMFPYSEFGTIPTGTSGKTLNAVEGFDFGFEVDGVPVAPLSTLKYLPKAVGSPVIFQEGDEVNFNLVVDQNIKQIDIISSIAKKFNLVFIPNPNNPRDIIIEPYSYYIGTGVVHDWTDKLSYDKGFSVEPALNFIESNLIFKDSEDGDYGNKEFKDRDKQVYGTQLFYGPTDFKSQTGVTETIFSPEVLRQWDTRDQPNNGGIKLPLGINYVGSSTTEEVGGLSQTFYAYKGIKTKPKLFWFLGCNNLFLDTLGEVYETSIYNTYNINVRNSSNSTGLSLLTAPIISHTMPMGMADADKINNDSACILFQSEFPVDIGVQTYNVYTENDAYSLFYDNRISNLYNSNTRFVNGAFDLKYSDIINLQPKDIIKIQQQYFYVNKISEYNLVNRELTRVELVQTNLNPQTYPTRYFKYQYCDQTGYTFSIATDFTNPNLRDTSFGWSIWYDQMMGTLGGSYTGLTSSLRDVRTGIGFFYIPFTMSEITKEEYETSGYYSWEYDTMLQHVWNYVNPSFPNQSYAFGLGLPAFWNSDDGEYDGLNLFTGCTQFNSYASAYGILTGSSIYYGTVPFVAKIDTTSFGNNYVVSLPYNSGGTYTGTIYWGDGTTSVNSFANRSHTYVTAGKYTIRVIGQITRFSTGVYTNTFENVVTSVEQFGRTFNFTNVGRYFEDCAILTKIGYDIPLTGITSLLQMFYRARLFNQNLNHWNVSGVTNMNLLFEEANVFNGDISSWNTGNVTSMLQMFFNARNFNQDISGWNTSKVTSLANTFNGAISFNSSIGSWNVSGITSLSATFENASSFNQPLNSWNVGNVTNMSRTFTRATSFNQPLNSWNTSKVTTTTSMFAGTPFNQNINVWDVSKVIGMASMFSDCTSFNQPLNSWIVSGVTNMNRTFSGASQFNQPLNSWNVGNVTIMDSMFARTPFNQPLNSWNTSKVTNMTSMFDNATLFNQNISVWDVSKVTDMINMFRAATSFNQPLNSWIVSGVTSMFGMFQNTTSFNQPLNSWNVGNVTSMIQMFSVATAFNQDISSWNVSKVTTMQSMFRDATSFNQNIGNWNISGVTSMALMLSGATSFSTTNLDNIYNGWSALPSLKTNVPFAATPCYTASAGRNILTGTYGWVITDGGLCP